MKWKNVKQEINCISREDKKIIEFLALLASDRENKKITQKQQPGQKE